MAGDLETAVPEAGRYITISLPVDAPARQTRDPPSCRRFVLQHGGEKKPCREIGDSDT